MVGKFVEFYGSGVAEVPLANRATIGNMSPEHGSTIAVFPTADTTTAPPRLTRPSQAPPPLVVASLSSALAAVCVRPSHAPPSAGDTRRAPPPKYDGAAHATPPPPRLLRPAVLPPPRPSCGGARRSVPRPADWWREPRRSFRESAAAVLRSRGLPGGARLL